MTLQHLHYVLVIAETGSLNKAAEKLFIAQPSLTSSLHELEKEIGITLFHRSGKGVTLTAEGMRFLPYAREVYNQYQNLLDVYGPEGKRRELFAVSTQHYSFAVKAFVELTRAYHVAEYEFAIRETRTRDVIEDVANMRSEIGILYLSDFNRQALMKLLTSSHLRFTHIIDCKAYVYLWKGHPLATQPQITFEDLAPYPCLSFEQGDQTNFYLAEEILSTKEYPQIIKCCDRATVLNLMIGLNGYTLCSGIICEELNGSDYIAVPYAADQDDIGSEMEIGYITRDHSVLSQVGRQYITEIHKYLGLEPPAFAFSKMK